MSPLCLSRRSKVEKRARKFRTCAKLNAQECVMCLATFYVCLEVQGHYPKTAHDCFVFYLSYCSASTIGVLKIETRHIHFKNQLECVLHEKWTNHYEHLMDRLQEPKLKFRSLNQFWSYHFSNKTMQKVIGAYFFFSFQIKFTEKYRSIKNW